MQTNQKTCIYSLFMQHTLGRLFVWKAGNQAAVPFDLDGNQIQTWADCFQRTRLQRVRRLFDALVHVQVDVFQAEQAKQEEHWIFVCVWAHRLSFLRSRVVVVFAVVVVAWAASKQDYNFMSVAQEDALVNVPVRTHSSCAAHYVNIYISGGYIHF